MLTAVGLGPGDSELLTLRACRLLRAADKVFVPGKVAREIIASVADSETLDFPMVADEETVRKAMEANSDRIALFAKEGNVVLGILGDPSFYSTYYRLCGIMKERHPEVECHTEPGISSITAFASRFGVNIDSGLVITDGAEPEALMLLKVRNPRQKVAELRTQGYHEFLLAERIFMDGEKLHHEADMPEHSDYFSILYARR